VDDGSSELMEEDDVTDVERGESELERLGYTVVMCWADLT